MTGAITSESAAAPARERLTLMRLYEALRERGYGGGYDAIRRYARGWAKGRSSLGADAYVPLTFAPGEAYRFDWSHEMVVIGGVVVGDQKGVFSQRWTLWGVSPARAPGYGGPLADIEAHEPALAPKRYLRPKPNILGGP